MADPIAVAPDDPRRCQAVNRKGQCYYKALEGSKFCMMHGGNRGVEKQAKESLRNYHLTKWRTKVLQMVDNPAILNLRDEIGILRVVLQERLERCKDASDLVMQSGPISDMICKIEKLVTSCDKLEKRMGMHLDKAAILQFAGHIIQIISECIEDEDILNQIADKITAEIGE